jgi:hypothetical protein
MNGVWVWEWCLGIHAMISAPCVSIEARQRRKDPWFNLASGCVQKSCNTLHRCCKVVLSKNCEQLRRAVSLCPAQSQAWAQNVLLDVSRQQAVGLPRGSQATHSSQLPGAAA